MNAKTVEIIIVLFSILIFNVGSYELDVVGFGYIVTSIVILLLGLSGIFQIDEDRNQLLLEQIKKSVDESVVSAFDERITGLKLHNDINGDKQ